MDNSINEKGKGTLLSDDMLKKVNGGNEGVFTDISQCPPGTRNMNNDFPDDEGYTKRCPYCDSPSVEDRFLFVPAWQAVFEGQECRGCGRAWRTKGHGISD